VADEKESELSRQDFESAPGRVEEAGDAAEPNEALGTILSAGPPFGVQQDAEDE